MKKKVVALMLAMSMTFTFSACGAAEDSSSETAQEDSASDTEDAVEESSVEDAEEESDAGEAVSESADEETEENEEESEEVDEYGFTESQQEALVESVKNAITTDFLEPYNISPSEFELQSYDVNDLYNYYLLLDERGIYEYVYTGDDPYETSRLWAGVDSVIFLTSDFVTRITFAADLAGDDTEAVTGKIESWILDGNITIPSTLEDASFSFDGSEEKIALGNAIYKGIAGFLNNLDTRECAVLLGNLGLKYYNNLSETVVVTYEDPTHGTTREADYPTTSIFDKVITENIQFE